MLQKHNSFADALELRLFSFKPLMLQMRNSFADALELHLFSF